MKSGLNIAFILGLIAASGCATTRYEEYTPGEKPSEIPMEASSSGGLAPDEKITSEADPGQMGPLLSMEERVSRMEEDLVRRWEDTRAATMDLATQVRSLSEQLTEIRKQLMAIRELRAGTSAQASPEIRTGRPGNQTPNTQTSSNTFRHGAGRRSRL